MSNLIQNNKPADIRKTHRAPYDQSKTHAYFQELSFDDLGTTAKSLNAYIRSVAPDILSCRTHVEITNNHATQVIYARRFVQGGTAATTALYQYKIAAAGGYVKIPMNAEMDLSIIADTASTNGIITELG